MKSREEQIETYIGVLRTKRSRLLQAACNARPRLSEVFDRIENISYLIYEMNSDLRMLREAMKAA